MGKLHTKKLALIAILGLLLIMALAACGGKSENVTSSENAPDGTPSDANEKNDSAVLSLASPPVGSSMNTVGSALSSVISTNSEVQVSNSPFVGITAWIPLLNEGDVGLGVASKPELAWVYRGEKGFDAMDQTRLLVNGNFLSTPGFAVRLDSGISSVPDLVGKRVAAEYPGEISVKAVLDAALEVNGVSWEDVNQVPIPTTVEGIQGLQDDLVEAAFGLAPGTPVLEEVHNAVPLKALNFLDGVAPDQLTEVPQSVHDTIDAYVPGAQLGVIQPAGYITEETIAIEYPLQLAASAHISDEVIYQIMEALWEYNEEVHHIHPWLQGWNREMMFDPAPAIPYHEGAVQFFKDIGLWTEETEQIQQELLQIN